MGFVKFDRRIKDWGWYTDTKTFKVFFHLILIANYTEKEFLGKSIKRGQVAISIGKLALETGLTPQEVRTAIKHLESTGEVTSKSQGKYTLFTVINYDLYQSEQQPFNNRLTTEQQSFNNYLTTIQEYKENKEIQEVEEVVCDDCDNFASDNELVTLDGKLGQGVVRLTERQIGKLLDELGLEGYDFYVSKLAEFIKSKGVKVGGHYRLIKKWAKEDAMV